MQFTDHDRDYYFNDMTTSNQVSAIIIPASNNSSKSQSGTEKTESVGLRIYSTHTNSSPPPATQVSSEFVDVLIESPRTSVKDQIQKESSDNFCNGVNKKLFHEDEGLRTQVSVTAGSTGSESEEGEELRNSQRRVLIERNINKEIGMGKEKHSRDYTSAVEEKNNIDVHNLLLSCKDGTKDNESQQPSGKTPTPISAPPLEGTGVFDCYFNCWFSKKDK